MDDATAVRQEGIAQVLASDAKTAQLIERLEGLLREAAEVEVELSRAEGAIRGVPHYSVIEGRAHTLGRQLSRAVQQRQMNEVVAAQPTTGKCPGCGTRCELEVRKRDVKAADGPLALQELMGYCPCCRRSFFPSAGDVGV
jgi:DNA repair exonuclease SbcCD ATPase subunit